MKISLSPQTRPLSFYQGELDGFKKSLEVAQLQQV